MPSSSDYNLAGSAMDIDASSSDMGRCPDCGKMVPQSNWELHQLRACRGRARSGTPSSTFQAPHISGTSNGDATEPTNVQCGSYRETQQNKDHSPPHKKPRAVEVDGRNRGRTVSTQATFDDSDDDDVEVVDVVDLSDSEPLTTAAAQDLTGDDDDDADDEAGSPKDHWACPQCTLWNPNSRPTCDACMYRNPNHVREPDATRTERLVGGPPLMQVLPPSPLSMVGGGALLGGIVGAAGNWIHGRDPLQGAIEGGTMGGVSGAFLHEALRATPARPSAITQVFTSGGGGRAANNDVAFARSSAAMGMAGYPSMANAERRSSNLAQPRSSIRVVRTVNPDDGSEHVVVDDGNRTTRTTRSNLARGAEYDPMLNYLLHAQLLSRGAIGWGGFGGARFDGPNIDNMNYEQLLAVFGDGTENMGADEGQIRQLPTTVLQNLERELPQDARQCLICLEDFEKGETRMVLPCLHGFHESCSEKWLRSNGSCPVCKHRL